nr:NAD-binding protein [Halotalea alkalilenta]
MHRADVRRCRRRASNAGTTRRAQEVRREGKKGTTGAGQYAKLFNNTLMIMNQGMIVKVLDLASRCGLDPRKTVEALKLGSAFSNSLSYLNTLITEQSGRG